MQLQEQMRMNRSKKLEMEKRQKVSGEDAYVRQEVTTMVFLRE